MSFFAGDTVDIKTFLFNCRDGKFSGTIEFYDNDINIGGTDFNLGGVCSAVVVGTSWVAEKGDHSISAKLVDGEFINSSGVVEDVIFTNTQTKVIKKNIDVDTDGDGVGNSIDKDDDGDGLSDGEEIKIGSDPLNTDTDSDGVLDNEDKEPTIFNSKSSLSGGVTLDNTNSEQLIPKEVVESAQNASKEITGALDSFRISQAENLKRVKNKHSPSPALPRVTLGKAGDVNVNESIPSKNKRKNKRSPTSFIKPLDYVVYFFAAISLYVFETKIVFYLFVLLVVFYLFKILRKLI